MRRRGIAATCEGCTGGETALSAAVFLPGVPLGVGAFSFHPQGTSGCALPCGDLVGSTPLASPCVPAGPEAFTLKKLECSKQARAAWIPQLGRLCATQ